MTSDGVVGNVLGQSQTAPPAAVRKEGRLQLCSSFKDVFISQRRAADQRRVALFLTLHHLLLHILTDWMELQGNIRSFGCVGLVWRKRKITGPQAETEIAAGG